MLLRLAALLLAGIVTGTPVSATACEILCATRASAESSEDAAAPRQSCHDTPSSQTSGAISGQGHVCDHDDDLPVSFGVTVDRSAPHSEVVFVVALPILSAPVVPFATRAAKFPPDPPASRVPLRI